MQTQITSNIFLHLQSFKELQKNNDVILSWSKTATLSNHDTEMVAEHSQPSAAGGDRHLVRGALGREF
jgi:hypothetical protein